MSVKVFSSFFIPVVSLLLKFKEFLCIMDNTLLTDVSFVNIFFQSVACLLVLLTLSFAKKVFSLNEVQIISASFYGSFLKCLILTVTFILKAIKVFSNVIFFEFYSFVLYI